MKSPASHLAVETLVSLCRELEKKAHVTLEDALNKATQEVAEMLEAHEACVEANPDNAAKFKDVLEYLKQDLHLAH